MAPTISNALGFAIVALLIGSAAPAGEPPKDVVDAAIAAGSFKTLVTAVQAAGLVATLKGPGPYTVFAPTDEAFAKVPKADLEALLKDKARLSAVLTNHVLPMKATAADLVALKTISSAQGSKLTFEGVKGGGFKVNGATVVKADIDVANGIIHAVDAVLLPQ
jgi:uncharacterized surface protein with fasciclin (FAS1) repeats